MAIEAANELNDMAGDDRNQIPDWRIRLLLRLGFPTSALIGLSIGFYQVSVWTGQNVITPLVQRQVQALKKLEDLMESAERSSRESNERGKQNAEKLDQVLMRLEHTSRTVKQ